jgi:preprotein translocase subunit SecY
VKLVFCKRNFKEKKKEKEKEKRKKKNYFLLFFLEILYFLQEIPTPFLENT